MEPMPSTNPQIIYDLELWRRHFILDLVCLSWLIQNILKYDVAGAIGATDIAGSLLS